MIELLQSILVYVAFLIIGAAAFVLVVALIHCAVIATLDCLHKRQTHQTSVSVSRSARKILARSSVPKTDASAQTLQTEV